MIDAIKVSKADPFVKRLLTASFPKYRGRKVRIQPTTQVCFSDTYYDGGSRNQFVSLDLATMEPRALTGRATQAFTRESFAIQQAPVPLPAGFVVVEHSIFCGKDVGVTIHVNPADLTPMLPAN